MIKYILIICFLLFRILILHFFVAESNNYEHNLTSDEKDALCVPYATKNISHNIETDKEKKTLPLQELSDQGNNSSYMTRLKRKLLNTDTGVCKFLCYICHVLLI